MEDKISDMTTTTPTCPPTCVLSPTPGMLSQLCVCVKHSHTSLEHRHTLLNSEHTYTHTPHSNTGSDRPVIDQNNSV